MVREDFCPAIIAAPFAQTALERSAGDACEQHCDDCMRGGAQCVRVCVFACRVINALALIIYVLENMMYVRMNSEL